MLGAFHKEIATFLVEVRLNPFLSIIHPILTSPKGSENADLTDQELVKVLIQM